ncbi:hypothetical protein [Flavobacterium reichenbachii]|uniref:Uncharacterized protein n=1 Tax=Flavobacterium reichenbachii TaxID=362418 RepID=A0A085ZDW4_9FLAO|nr:hypothetical protein [Flavobacterium reichenbachii]KFF02628.1 hypothetical protein IW19_23465 [Flavobacterium reichenbachii]OXB11125.1 hypothetical protein B0A68_21100 [Flavobacterium reichenbachii]
MILKNYINDSYQDSNESDVYNDPTVEVTSYEEQLLLQYDDYLKTGFSNPSFASKQYDYSLQTKLEEEEDDDATEDQDEEPDPETFSDDGLKVD